MSKLRGVVVDDEALARQVLREMLQAGGGAVPEVEIVAECGNGLEAIQAVQEHHPDVLLLDVQMPKLDGFEVLELLGAEAPAVVFVTAHDEYALRAFEVHAVDYLLKPFSAERLAEALRRALARQAPVAAGALAAVAHPGYVRRVAVREGARVTFLAAGQLDYAEAQDDYIGLASGGKLHLKQQTIASLEAQLDPAEFVRIHRKYLVRIDRIARLEPCGDNYIAVLELPTGAVRLPVSRGGYQRLRRSL